MHYIIALFIVCCYHHAIATDDDMPTHPQSISVNIDTKITNTMYSVNVSESRNLTFYIFELPIRVPVKEVKDSETAIWIASSDQECLAIYLIELKDNSIKYLRLYVKSSEALVDIYYERECSNPWVKSDANKPFKRHGFVGDKDSQVNKTELVSLNVLETISARGVSVTRIYREDQVRYRYQADVDYMINEIKVGTTLLWSMKSNVERVMNVFVILRRSHPSIVYLLFHPFCGCKDLCFVGDDTGWLPAGLDEYFCYVPESHGNEIFIPPIHVVVDVSTGLSNENGDFLVQRQQQDGVTICNYSNVSDNPITMVKDGNVVVWVVKSSNESCLEVIHNDAGYISLIYLLVSTAQGTRHEYYEKVNGLWVLINHDLYQSRWDQIHLTNNYQEWIGQNLKGNTRVTYIPVDLNNRNSTEQYDVITHRESNSITLQYKPYHGYSFSTILFNGVVIWENEDKATRCIDVFVTTQENKAVLIRLSIDSHCTIIGQYYLKDDDGWVKIDSENCHNVLTKIDEGNVIRPSPIKYNQRLALQGINVDGDTTNNPGVSGLNEPSTSRSKNTRIGLQHTIASDCISKSDEIILDLSSTSNDKCTVNIAAERKTELQTLTYKPISGLFLKVVEGTFLIWHYQTAVCDCVEVISMPSGPILLRLSISEDTHSKELYFEKSEAWVETNKCRFASKLKRLKSGRHDVIVNLDVKESTEGFIVTTDSSKENMEKYTYKPRSSFTVDQVKHGKTILWKNPNDEKCRRIATFYILSKIFVELSILTSSKITKCLYYIYQDCKWEAQHSTHYKNELKRARNT